MDKGPEKITYPAIREELWQATVAPGLKLFILPKAGYQKKYATFTTHFGSIDSRFQVEGKEEVLDVPDGVAHFLEHKMFESEQGDTFAEFARLGASANAYTEFAITSYLFSATDNFEPALDVLLNFVQEPYFTEQTVEKEKGIIGQEIRMYQDDPDWRVFFDLLGALYHKHPVRIDIAGTIDSISKITPETLYNCYNTFYHPSNMAVFITGDVDPHRVTEQVAENLARHNHRPQGQIRRFYPQEPEMVNAREARAKLDVSEPIINIGFKERNPGREGLLRRDVVTNILLEILFGPGSPLYNSLYEDGLIDEDFEAAHAAYVTFGHTMVGGKTRDPETLNNRIMEAVERVRKEGINEEDFNRIQKKLQGEFLRHMNSLEYIAGKFNAYYFKGSSLFDYIEHLQQATPDQVNRRLQEHLHPGFSAVSLVLPE